jgi:pyridinium-3,5-bisthiocarboxylic acid mononucleotide nickel chelatase
MDQPSENQFAETPQPVVGKPAKKGTRTIAYFDCPTGIAGDMCLGALVDAGVPLDYLTQQINRLGIQDEFRLSKKFLHHNGQIATKVMVEYREHGLFRQDSDHNHDPLPSHDHHHDPSHNHEHFHTRTLPNIEQMIHSAHLPDRVTAWSLAIFRQLAIAEGAVHGISPEQVHFHEVGAVDAIVDIVGTCLGLDWLGIDEIYGSRLPTGGGTVNAAHGRLPVPVPAVLKLLELRQVPIHYNGIDRELVTPTGAAIVTTLATHFGHPPTMVLQKIALGAGTLALPIPNILRLWIGESSDPSHSDPSHSHSDPSHSHSHSHPIVQTFRRNVSTKFSALAGEFSALAGEFSASAGEFSTLADRQTIATLETQIDDLNPQAIGYLFDRLFDLGVLDVFTQAIGMKKSRPGILLTVICLPEQIPACEQMIFQETTTLGIRHCLQARSALAREFQHVHTDYGTVHLKIAKLGDRIVNAQPEYEDCAALARTHQIPWREIQQQALAIWYQKYPVQP